jgi:glucose/arabinose dehydrogenase
VESRRLRSIGVLTFVGALILPALAPDANVARAGPALDEEVYVRGIDKPSDIIWIPGSKTLFVTEEDTGKIRIIRRGRLLSRPCINLNVEIAGDGGLQGIALHPNFADNHYVFAYYSHEETQTNRLTRFTLDDGKCIKPKRILWGIGLGDMHQGGQLLFVGGKLFVTTGDNQKPARAQNDDRLEGKVLRLNPDGTIPPTNPMWDGVAPSRVWSKGHRNGFGLAATPEGDIYESENGHLCDDELNLIEAGSNYGWGVNYQCYAEDPVNYAVGPDPVPPVFRWEDVVAPTDAWWYEGRLDTLDDCLLVGDWIYGQIHCFRPPVDGEAPDPVVFDSSKNKIISMTKGPGGWLYFTAREGVGDKPSGVFRLVTE